MFSYQLTLDKKIDAHCTSGQSDNVEILMDNIDAKEREAPNKTNSDILEEAYTMYTFLAYCPQVESLQRVLTDLFQHYPSRIIVDQFENIIKGKRASFIEKEVYKRLDDIFGFQSGKITLAMSSRPDIKLDLDMDIPHLLSVRGDILSCFNSSQCINIDNILQEIGNIRLNAFYIIPNLAN